MPIGLKKSLEETQRNLCIITKQKRQSQNRSLNNEFPQGFFHVPVPQAINEGVQQWSDHCVHHRGNGALVPGGAG